MSLYVGTSGWAYKEWKPAFYPDSLPQDEFLGYYGSQLGACEINGTHYRLPSGEMVDRWAAAVPPGFRFTAKAHRRLTDKAPLAWGDLERAFLGRFVRAVAPLGDALGAVLIQLPPETDRDDAALAAVLASLPAQVNFAVEFKNDTWIDEAVFAQIAAHGAAPCVSERDGRVFDRLPDGPFAYVRLRGEHYSDEARDGWLELLRRESRDRDVFVFARHEAIPAGNPNAGVGLAQWLMSATREAL